MNYSEVLDIALSYADRADTDITSRMDNFLRIVESRINRFLKTMKMSARAVMITDANMEYYGLPDDFNGLRDIEVRASLDAEKRITLKYLAPEHMNSVTTLNTVSNVYYTIIGDQLQIRPVQENQILEITYYQKLLALGTLQTENWLSIDFPDVYIFGLMVELSSFTKDKESALMWEQRFSDVLTAIQDNDSSNRWSGTSLEVRYG